ncbi:LysR family transcriptional regulator [Ottowia thiooxydans]|uniref:LysR family transcriptional regulator n=1 Tax=Ottowia thiooxydans TaxID=219182 RepID=UPI001B7F8F21|nr:LysR family transcriptional regulator [Ottowia thiooxydans]
MNYRVDDLRALAALHATGSFVRAAERLHITQSALSRRISQLEAVIGGSLVQRTTRRVALTSLGLELIRKTALLLDQLDDAVVEAGRCARGESGRIDVACLTTVAYSLLPPVLDAFRKRYPHVRLHLRDDTGQRVAQAVLAREAEFGIGVLGHPSTELYAEHCVDDPYVIAFRAGHALQKRKRVAWTDLQAWRVVALRSTSANRQQIDEALAAEGIASPWFDEVEHLSSMLGLLRGGVGIGVLPHLALHSGAAVDLLSRPLHSPDIVRRIGLFRRQDTQLSQPAAVLWDMLREHMARYS